MERHGARKKHRAVPDHTTTPDPATWPDETIPPLVLTFKVRASNGRPLFKTPILTPDTEQTGSCHNWSLRQPSVALPNAPVAIGMVHSGD